MTHRPHLLLSASTTLYIERTKEWASKGAKSRDTASSITRRLHRAVRYAAHSSAA